MSRDRRWIVLATDGKHATLGRAAQPTEAEVAQAASALAAAGLAGGQRNFLIGGWTPPGIVPRYAPSQSGEDGCHRLQDRSCSH